MKSEVFLEMHKASVINTNRKNETIELKIKTT